MLTATHISILSGLIEKLNATKFVVAPTLLSSALWGSLLIYLGRLSKNFNQWHLISGLVLIGLCIFTLDSLAYHFTLMIILASIVLITLLICFIRIPNATQDNNLVTATLCLALPLFIIFSSIPIYLTSFFYPKTYDVVLFEMDATLGVYPTILAAKYLLLFPTSFKLLLSLIYSGLPFTFALGYFLLASFSPKDVRPLAMQFLVIGLGGILLYNLIPACGTACAFGSLIKMVPETIHLQGWQSTLPISPGIWPRNCLPSLHTAWILCLWRYTWFTRPTLRLGGTVWAILGLFATLVIGQHYLTDIMVGFTFATFCIGTCNLKSLKATPSLITALVGLTGCIAWYLLIRYGLVTLQTYPALSKTLYILTPMTTLSALYYERYCQQSTILPRKLILKENLGLH